MVLLPDTPDRVVGLLQALAEQTDGEFKIFGSASWNDPVLLRGYGPLLEGARFVTPFFAGSSSRSVMNFVESYRAQFGETPDLLAAQGYDAAQLVVAALEEGNETSEMMARALRKGSVFEGVTGKLTETAQGEISRRMSVILIKGGVAQEVMASGVPTGEPG